jgi:arylsulfatase A-like enzyme
MTETGESYMGLAEDDRAIARRSQDVLVADHGEHFGEKGLERHGNSLYTQLLHVPLIVNAPWLAPGHVSAPVDLVQFPSIVNAAASRSQLPSPLPIATAVLVPQRVVSYNRWWSVIAGRWHLVVHDPGREEFFDMLADPSEASPLPEDRVPGEVAARLRIEVQHLRSTAAPDRGEYFRSLGYVQ